MAHWKLWTGVSVVVVVGLISALTAALWNNADSEWVVERNAAQFALDKSPLNHITSHQVFTGNDVQEVFEGPDAFGRVWYAFVYGSPFQVHYVEKSSVVPETAVEKKAKSLHLSTQSIQIGYLDTAKQADFHTSSNVVWEVYGTDATDKHVYAYFDGTTGGLLMAPYRF